jgi:hypothetical protein
MRVIPRRDSSRSNSLVFSLQRYDKRHNTRKGYFFLFSCNHEHLKRCCQSQSYFMADRRWVSRAHFVDVCPILRRFQELWSEMCCPLSVGRPLWREVGSVIWQSLYGCQSVINLGVAPTLWTFDQIMFPFQEFGPVICCPPSVGSPLGQEAGYVLCRSQCSLLSVCKMSWRISMYVKDLFYLPDPDFGRFNDLPNPVRIFL